MAQRRLTIDLPRSGEALHHLLQVLLDHGLISEQKARTIEEEESSGTGRKKSRWAKAAERLLAEDCLKGRSEEARELFSEFREDFDM